MSDDSRPPIEEPKVHMIGEYNLRPIIKELRDCLLDIAKGSKRRPSPADLMELADEIGWLRVSHAYYRALALPDRTAIQDVLEHVVLPRIDRVIAGALDDKDKLVHLKEAILAFAPPPSNIPGFDAAVAAGVLRAPAPIGIAMTVSLPVEEPIWHGYAESLAHA
jgi:hypothetical protein